MDERFRTLIDEYRHRAGWTVEKLAERAHLSDHSVVSRAIHPPWPPRVRNVRALIEALDAECNFDGTQLQELAVAYLFPEVPKKTRRQAATIGLLVPSVAFSAIWSRVIGAVAECATEQHYSINLMLHKEDIDTESDFLEDFVGSLPRAGMAGLIVAPAVGIRNPSRELMDDLEATYANLLRRNIPIVFIDRKRNTLLPIPYVGLDNEHAAALAVNHFVDRHHRRIATILALGQSSSQQERYAGYRRALEAHNLPRNALWERFGRDVRERDRESFYGQYGVRFSRTNALDLLRLPPGERPTAIFCGTYYIALEVLRAVRELDATGESLSVPKHLSLIGFDDVPDLANATPPITRITYSVEDLARAAVDKLIALIEHKDDAKVLEDIRLPIAKLTEGESVQAPPSD